MVRTPVKGGYMARGSLVVHRYAFGKLSPTCDCCNWYMAANSTERDNYVGDCSRYMVNRGKVPPAPCW